MAVVLLATGCGGYGGKSKSSSTESSGGGGKTTVAGVPANNHGTKSVSSEAEVELDDYYFEPTVLKGKPGQKVTLELKNEGKVAHTFTISNQSVDKELQPGDEGQVDVTFPQSGQVEFVCKFHQSSGMIGALQAGPSSSSSSNTTSTSKY